MYKTYTKHWDVLKPNIPKILLIMRLTIIILIATILQVSASTFAQKITLQEQNAPIAKVFKKITEQSGYGFFVPQSLLKNTKPVSITVKNAELAEVLKAIFENQPIDYKIEDNSVTVSKKDISFLERIIERLQEIEIKGKVVDENKQPLAGASVRIKGIRKTIITDAYGNFSLTVAKESEILEISFVGYTTIEVSAKQAKEIQLSKSTSKLDEVQIIAYGTTTKRLNTGNVGTVSAKEIENQPVSNPLAALQGRVPGVVITQSSGVPGAAIKVEIRGRTAIDLNISKNDPLYIIDGVPFEMGNTPVNILTSAANNPTSTSQGGLSALNMINPQDIESIEVLKDADATAIYGSRGANGVILITTKLGSVQKLSINAKVSAGASKVTRLMKMLNTSQYVAMRKEAFANDGITPTIANAPDIMVWDTTRNTDIQKILAGGTARYNDANISVSGGNQQTSFLVGAALHNETTVLPGDFSSTRISVNSSLNHTSLNKRFSFTLKTIYSNGNDQTPAFDPSQYFRLPPNTMLRDALGNIAWEEKGVSLSSVNNLPNPLALLNERYRSNNDNLSTNLNLKFEMLKGLYLKSSFGYNVLRTDESSQYPKSSIDPTSANLPRAQFGNSVSKSWIIEPQLEYLRQIQKAKINILLGSTFQNRVYQGNRVEGLNYTDDLLLSSISAAGSVLASNFFNQYRYTALFGRLNLSWAEKYLINLTARRDGSSRFGPEERFSNFGAVGAAWIFTSEKFFKNNVKWLSFGKLRSSYGISGNDQIGDYKFYDLWLNTTNSYQGVSGMFPTGLFNPNYEWESNRKFEVAGEFSFFKERIDLNIAYYRHRSSNQLVNYNLPTQTGFQTVVRNMPALVQNTGVEFSLSGRIIRNSLLKYVTSFNLTIPRNKLRSFPSLAQSSYYRLYIEGEPLSVINRFHYLGVDPSTGVYTFEDVNKDGNLTTSGDYQVLGNREPNFYGGWQNTFSYKGFELDFFVQFMKQIGANYLSSVSSYYPGRPLNQPSIVLDRWMKPGDNKPFQRYTTATSTPPGQAAATRLNLSDGIYSDASFLRLKTVSISYLPKLKAILKNTNLRFFVSGQNLLTVTNFKGSDPETQSYFQLPPMRTFVGGMQFTF